MLGVLIPRKESNAMKKAITALTALPPTGMGTVDKAWDAVSVSFDRFCLTAGIEALGTMMEQDAEQACGARHARSDGRRGHRWGRTQGKIGFHAGKVAVERPRVRDLEGHELALPSWERAVAEDWLGKWAMNLMLINVSTRKFRRAVRLPEGDVPAPAGAGVSKSAASRHFVGVVGCAQEGMDGCGPVRARHRIDEHKMLGDVDAVQTTDAVSKPWGSL